MNYIGANIPNITVNDCFKNTGCELVAGTTYISKSKQENKIITSKPYNSGKRKKLIKHLTK